MSIPASEFVNPSHHNGSSFKNPWPPVLGLVHSAASFLRLPLARAPPPNNLHITPVQTVKPNFEFLNAGPDHIYAMWLGHAGFLVQLPLTKDAQKQGEQPTRILFDPIFAERASPSSYFGPRRYLSPPCTAEELPVVDFVVISHNHYDHLDLGTLRYIWENSCRLGRPLAFLVPLGLKGLLTTIGIRHEQIYELDWWHSVSFPTSTAGLGPSIIFVCTPAQHNSGRGILDQQSTLWSSWVVRQIIHDNPTPLASVYHAGDTGYQTADGPCPVFREIGDKYGPFDLAMIPIWRGATLSFIGKMGFRLTDDTPLRSLHASPEDAVSLASDIRARHSLAMHFATFAGSEDEALEPLMRLTRVRSADWHEEGGFGAIDMGECVTITCMPAVVQ